MGNRLPGLDALRGIAALTVVAYHLGLPIRGAHLAVDFFFMLSGFVMARTYEQRLRSGELSPVRFMAKRYLRLWPMMAIGASIGFVAIVAEEGSSADLWLAYGFTLLMLPAFNLAAPYALNLPLWSIVGELIANAAHGFALARSRSRILLAIAAAAGVGVTLSIAQGGFLGGFVLYRVFLAYVAGILVFRSFGDRPPLTIPFWVAALALPAYVCAVWAWPWPWAPLAFVLVIAPLMMFGGMAARFASPGAAALAAALGAASFPLYAIHYPTFELLGLTWGPVALGGALAAAWLLQRLRGRPVGGVPDPVPL